MDQGRREVDVKDGEEEDHMDCQSNQEEGDHPHFECQHGAGSAEQPRGMGTEEARFNGFAGERREQEETEINTQ